MTTQYEQLSLRLNVPVMRRQVTEIHRGDDGYITYAELADGGPWKQWHYLVDDLVNYLESLPPGAGDLNRYISINSFRRPQRSLDYLWHLNALYMDIDYHAPGTPEGAPEAFLEYLEGAVFGATLPLPSLVIKTGRGLQLIWLIDHLPRQAVPFWAVAQEAARARMEAAARAYQEKGATPPLVDNCADIARVFRLGGTYNTRAGRMAEMICYADEAPTYRLDRLRDRWFPELKGTSSRFLGAGVKAKRQSLSSSLTEGASPHSVKEGLKSNSNTLNDPLSEQRSRSKTLWLFNQYTLHLARREDVSTLLELRQRAHLPEDCRRRMVFLYRYWSCCALMDLRCALEDALRFNSRFLEPLPEPVVAKETRSAEMAYMKWRAFQDLSPEEQAAHTGAQPGYNYKNATLIKLLGITDEEQAHLKTIIGTAEKYARRNRKDAERGWRHERRDGRDRAGTTAKQRALLEEAAYAQRLTALGMNQRDIAAHMGVSLGKVNRLLKNEDAASAQAVEQEKKTGRGKVSRVDLQEMNG